MQMFLSVAFKDDCILPFDVLLNCFICHCFHAAKIFLFKSIININIKYIYKHKHT